MSASVNPPSGTQGFVELVSRTVVLRERNIDTDQIIPARFLTTTERKGLGRFAFNDWRYLADGSLNPAFELNKPHNAGAAILVAGRNFGCGSSREHAPWALTDLGLRAVISSEIADIFRSNSLKNGLLPIVVAQELLDELLEQPGIELRVDVRTRTLHLPDGRGVQFPLDAFAQTCLIEGVDQLGYLLRQIDAIHQFEQRRDAAIDNQQEQHHAR
ncbi:MULTISPECIES: 3-isopropylmalate dehydratase small subunit [unclassified Lysobacter]|uniref:3-isopropylmalate dehydratase small subunit n=1 Tax=unclassified Lysobacter TaxID=2635362 RepID=UPI001BE8B210|nr:MULTISPECIES: 3-isopropylmalate dehydratase small subunit [unclassified Lysobacter]MBT2746346.1 3-isopropylmalate dehydratase small subunit [Lysobacter sp. ISL-42]MBT2751181.1 3-isopropylmalate dehydratase small subunit [Lysobacter sp. ISL-50]MBT2775589.1 3-isopropylmalate dehydratase small subunit [Lysobacter sp. ISL-54]MBT2779974.1 3-isopropylmalate dehydratase small subunit [Lysobacter sp. ISL-52]